MKSVKCWVGGEHNYKTKLPRKIRGSLPTKQASVKIVADAAEPPVTIPAAVVAVDVHVVLIIPPVERGELCDVPSVPLPLDYSRGCI